MLDLATQKKMEEEDTVGKIKILIDIKEML